MICDARRGRTWRTALVLLTSFWIYSDPSMGAEPKRGGTLTVGLSQEPLVVDPIRTGSFVERQFAVPVYESLFDINEQGLPAPWLAESFEWSEDARVLTVKIRTGIKFHDGTILDSAAVVANLERTRNPANACRCLSSLAELKDVKALDDQTIAFTLDRPNAAFVTVLADAPGIMVSPTGFRNNSSEIGLKPVGTGPFKFSEWVRNSKLVYVRNPDYWRRGEPYLDSVVLRGIQNSETIQAAFLSGQSDLVIQVSTRFASQMRRDSKYVVLQHGGFGYDGVYMNTTEPPFDDIRVRKAVAHGIDRELLRTTLLHGIPRLGGSPFGPGNWAHQEIAAYPQYDPEKAKELVAAYGRPIAFPLLYNNSPQSQQLAQSIQEMLGRIGMKVSLQPVEQNRHVQNMSSKQYVASLYRFTGRADPHQNVYQFFYSAFADVIPSSNHTRFKNTKADELIEKGMTSQDLEQRKAIYKQLSEVLAGELPVAFMFYPADTMVHSKRVHGIRNVPDGLVRFGGVWKD